MLWKSTDGCPCHGVQAHAAFLLHAHHVYENAVRQLLAVVPAAKHRALQGLRDALNATACHRMDFYAHLSMLKCYANAEWPWQWYRRVQQLRNHHSIRTSKIITCCSDITTLLAFRQQGTHLRKLKNCKRRSSRWLRKDLWMQMAARRRMTRFAISNSLRAWCARHQHWMVKASAEQTTAAAAYKMIGLPANNEHREKLNMHDDHLM